jgi:hypothetical protein
MSETPIGDAVESEVMDPVLDESYEEDPGAEDDEAGDTGDPDQLPEPGPGETDEGELTEDTGSLIDEDEDPGTPLEDDPFVLPGVPGE